MITAGSRKSLSQIQKLIISFWIKKELPQQWKVSTTETIYMEGDKADSCNYRDIQHILTTDTTLNNILPSSFAPYADKMVGDRQRGLRRNRSTTDHIVEE